MSPYCPEISPHATGRPQSTGHLIMPLWTDATAVPQGLVKRISCPFGRPDSRQCPSSRRDASGGVKTSNPRRQENHPQRLVGRICVRDPAQAAFVAECGSTCPKMASVSHPRLVTTAPLQIHADGLPRRAIMASDDRLPQPDGTTTGTVEGISVNVATSYNARFPVASPPSCRPDWPIAVLCQMLPEMLTRLKTSPRGRTRRLRDLDKGVSSNRTNIPTSRPRVHNVWPYY